VYGLLHTRIDAGQNHRLIVPLGRKRDVWNEPKRRSAYRDGPYKVPAIEFAIQKTSATRAGSLTSDHLRGRQKCATVTGGVSGIERGSINFAMRRSSTW